MLLESKCCFTNLENVIMEADRCFSMHLMKAARISAGSLHNNYIWLLAISKHVFNNYVHVTDSPGLKDIKLFLFVQVPEIYA